MKKVIIYKLVSEKNGLTHRLPIVIGESKEGANQGLKDQVKDCETKGVDKGIYIGRYEVHEAELGECSERGGLITEVVDSFEVGLDELIKLSE